MAQVREYYNLYCLPLSITSALLSVVLTTTSETRQIWRKEAPAERTTCKNWKMCLAFVFMNEKVTWYCMCCSMDGTPCTQTRGTKATATADGAGDGCPVVALHTFNPSSRRQRQAFRVQGQPGLQSGAPGQLGVHRETLSRWEGGAEWGLFIVSMKSAVPKEKEHWECPLTKLSCISTLYCHFLILILCHMFWASVWI